MKTSLPMRGERIGSLLRTMLKHGDLVAASGGVVLPSRLNMARWRTVPQLPVRLRACVPRIRDHIVHRISADAALAGDVSAKQPVQAPRGGPPSAGFSYPAAVSAADANPGTPVT
jgi:hypothetical protein